MERREFDQLLGRLRPSVTPTQALFEVAQAMYGSGDMPGGYNGHTAVVALVAQYPSAFQAIASLLAAAHAAADEKVAAERKAAAESQTQAYRNYERAVSELRAERGRLHERIDAARADLILAKKQRDDARENMDAIAVNLGVAQGQISELQAERKQLNERIGALSNTERVQRDFTTLTSEHRWTLDRVDALQRSLALAEGQLSELHRKYADIVGLHSGTVDSLALAKTQLAGERERAVTAEREREVAESVAEVYVDLYGDSVAMVVGQAAQYRIDKRDAMRDQP